LYNQLPSSLSIEYYSNEGVHQFQHSGYSTSALITVTSQLQGHLAHIITKCVSD